MHTAALLGEGLFESAAAYGWLINGSSDGTNDVVKHSWNILRQNVQRHIKKLNFGYRTQLREEGVTYLNKLGK